MPNKRVPHPDDLATAIVHFNSTFRHRYRLPRIGLERLLQAQGLEEELENLATVRANGVADASCALIPREPSRSSRATRSGSSMAAAA